MHYWILAGMLGLSGFATPPDSVQRDAQLDVRAFRFYRAEGSETLITGLIEIPYHLLTAMSGTPRRLVGEVAVTVRDSSGLTLHHSSWRVQAPVMGEDPRASLVERVEFKVTPGKYDLEVALTDSASGRSTSRNVPIVAYAVAPAASDVVLSPSIRLTDGRDTTLGPGEWRWGNMALTPVVNLRLTPVRARAFYLVEVYPAQDTAVTMSARVLDDEGKVLVTTPARRVPVSHSGAMLRGQVDLTGLPSGHYRLSVLLDQGERVDERSDGFTMAEFGETMEREGIRLAVLRETDEGLFGQMNQVQLDEAAAPLTYISSADSLSVWKSGLSVAAKRQFLTRFWQQRDPTPGTPKNEVREAFYNRIAEANRQFGETGRTRVPGWRTDRGRIAVVNGDPSEQLDRRIGGGTAPPYLVWRYQRGKDRYYIFTDRTGFGVYKLIASNDLKETGSPGFRDILGGEALQDISRWLGIDLFKGDQAGSVR
jgi:GWxTD domain-containing protein